MCTWWRMTGHRPESVSPACRRLLQRSAMRFSRRPASACAICHSASWALPRLQRGHDTCPVKKYFSCFVFTIAIFGSPLFAQRIPVLPQIDLPHPYYYRELYLPQLTSGPSSVAWAPDSKEIVYSMAGAFWGQKLDSKEALEMTDRPSYDY